MHHILQGIFDTLPFILIIMFITYNMTRLRRDIAFLERESKRHLIAIDLLHDEVDVLKEKLTKHRFM